MRVSHRNFARRSFHLSLREFSTKNSKYPSWLFLEDDVISQVEYFFAKFKIQKYYAWDITFDKKLEDKKYKTQNQLNKHFYQDLAPVRCFFR